jgi:hypothetical protein
MQKKKKTKFNWMLLLIPLGPLFLIIVGLSTVAKVGKLKDAIARFDASKNEESAIFLYNELITTNGLHMFFFKAAASQTHPIPTQRWTFVFNKLVNPCKNVTLETKKDIKNCLISFGAYGLDEVGEHTYVTAEEFGKLSEENVWFSLSQLASRNGYNVFSNIRLPYKGINVNSQEIDAMVVCPKGVFLIEIKSSSSKQDIPVVFDDIINPFQQICMHEEAFIQNFGDIYHKNLLVMSYPKGNRVKIDLSTFPQNSTYTSLTVETLFEYMVSLDGEDVLSDEMITSVSSKLTGCIYYKDNEPITKWIINGKQGQP